MKFDIHPQTPTVDPLKFGMVKKFEPILYCAYDYLSMPEG